MSNFTSTASVLELLCKSLNETFAQYSPSAFATCEAYQDDHRFNFEELNYSSLFNYNSCGSSQSSQSSNDSSAEEPNEVKAPLVARQRVPKKARKRFIPQIFCNFCKKNGEPAEYYNKHVLKDRRGVVVCPVLRKFNCPFCNNGGGDRAHTARFCPMNPEADPNSKPIPELLRTGHNSFGKKFINYSI